MVEEFLGIRFYKKRSVVDLHEHFLGSNDDKITHQIKFRKKSILSNSIIFLYIYRRFLMDFTIKFYLVSILFIHV